MSNNYTSSGLVQRVARADRYRKRGYEEVSERSREEEDPIRSLEQTIFNMGSKHPTLTVEEDVEQTSEMLRGDFGRAPARIAESIAICILELPHKLQLYVKLLEHLKEEDTVIMPILECVSGLFKQSCEYGPWRHFSQSFRFFAACTEQGILARTSMDRLYENIFSFIPTVDNIKTADFLIWTCCAALLVDRANTTLKENIQAYFAQRSKHTIAIPADLSMVWKCCETVDTVAPGVPDDPAFARVLDLAITSIQLDNHWDGDYRPLSLFGDSFACNEWQRWSILYSCRILVESLELNHRRCSDFLLNAIPLELGNADKIIVEFLFGELIRLRRNGMPCLVYESLLMDCCRLSRAFAPAMAKGLSLIFAQLDQLSFTANDKLSSWFAHHLSNFDFKWNWMGWQSVLLSASATSLQTIFVRSTIDKLLRLSFRDRVAPTLPDEFKAFLPTDPIANFKYSQDADDEESEVAANVVKAIEQRQSVDQIKAVLGEAQQDGGLDAVQREILLQSLLYVGSKSLSHTLAIVEKYLPLFQLLLPPSSQSSGNQRAKVTANFFILDQISSFWSSSALHFEFVVERLINYRVLLPLAVVKWAVERTDEQLSNIADDDVDTALYRAIHFTISRNLILRTIQQSAMMPAQAQQRMRDAPVEKIKSTVSTLTTEFDETIVMVVEMLAMLPEQLVSLSAEVNARIKTITVDYIRELAFTYSTQLAALSGLVLQNLGSRGAPGEVKLILEQVQSQ